MLSILLAILKIIGLILLAIIGLVLLILLTVLLVPIRYEAEAAMAENKPTAKVGVYWLLHFICVRVRYGDDGLHYRVKVSGFTVLDSDKPKVEKPKKQKEKNQKPDKIEKNAEKTAEIDEKAADLQQDQIQYVEMNESVGQTTDMKAEQQADEMAEKADIKKTEEKKSLKEKLEDLKTKKDEIGSKIQDIKAKVDEVLTYLQSPKGRKLMTFLKKKLFRLLRHLKPKALKINGRIGLSDPAATGQILGITYMLYPLYGEHIHLTGEFEEEIIEGDFYIKGRIRLGTLLLTAIQIILNKEVRMWIKKATGGNRK